MADAEAKDITVDGKVVDEFKAIANKNTGEIAQIATDKYQILQHRDFFSLMESEMSALGLNDFYGYILEKDGGNSYVARLILRNNFIEEPELGQNVAIGVEFRNSINKFMAASGHAHFLRLSCTNGMTVRSMLPEIDFSRNHNARNMKEMFEAVSNKSRGFISGILNSDKQFFEIICNAREDQIKYTDLVQMYSSIEEIIGTKKHSENIGDILRRDVLKQRDQNGQIFTDRWQLYNAVTYYTSHGNITPDIFDQILVKAENKILNTNHEIPLPIPQKIKIIG
jgi:hypothetical protein